MIWWFFAIGMLTLGGYCLCCGCSYCTDSATTSTMQLDVGGITADLDTASCCTSLNGTYILDVDPTNFCRFTRSASDGQCESAECTNCICGGATTTCVDDTVICNPAASVPCSADGTIFRSPECDNCDNTEGGATTFPAGSSSVACDCACQVTTLVWGVDVDPTGYPWAVPGEFVYKCNCIGFPCEGTHSSSAISLTAEILDNSPGVRLFVQGSATGGVFAATTTVDPTNPSVDCATSISGLDMSADLGSTPCSDTYGCLCNAPTTLTATFIP